MNADIGTLSDGEVTWGPFLNCYQRLLEIEDDRVTEVPSFWSYQGKGVYQLNNTHRLVVNTIAAYDFGELNFTSDEVSDSDLRGPLSSNNPLRFTRDSSLFRETGCIHVNCVTHAFILSHGT